MHEQALLRDLLRKIEEVARSAHALRVKRVALWIGALSHLSEDALRGQWPQLTHGTVAERAELRVTNSLDLDDPRAQGVVLTSVEVESG